MLELKSLHAHLHGLSKYRLEQCVMKNNESNAKQFDLMSLG